MKNTRSETGTVRRLESEAAREADALSLAIADLNFVVECCNRLLDDQSIQLGDRGRMLDDQTYQRALWDTALVTFFKHAKQPAHAFVRGTIEDVIRRSPNNLERQFESWEQERDQRIAHPVGHEEAYRVGVSRSSTEVVAIGIARRRVRVNDSGVEVFRAATMAALQSLDQRYGDVRDTLTEEASQLTEEQYAELPTLPLNPHKRPPGLK